MTKYRKNPVVIDAFKWTGGHDQTEDPEWIIEAIKKDIVRINETENGCNLSIITLEGAMLANQGDYIIRGIAGEIYPCKPEIFEATYENAFPKVNSSNIGRFIIETDYIRNHTYAVMDLLRDVVVVEATQHFEGYTEYVGLSHKFKEVHPSCKPPIYGIYVTTYSNGTISMEFQEVNK